MSTRNKTVLNLSIGGQTIKSHNAANDFTSDAISFPDRNSGYSFSVDNWAGVTVVGTPTITILASNAEDGTFEEFKTIATDIDISTTVNRKTFDAEFPFKYMKIKYVSGGSTGTFDFTMAK